MLALSASCAPTWLASVPRPQAVTVVGRIARANGRPVPGAIIVSAQDSAISRGDGTFSVSGVRAGMISVIVRNTGSTEIRLPAIDTFAGDSIIILAMADSVGASTGASPAHVAIHEVRVPPYPLVVIDGAIAGGAEEAPNLRTRRIAKIESILPLQGVALYGPSAARGLLIVTTRRER